MLYRLPTNPRYLRSIPFTIPKNLCSKFLLLLLRCLTLSQYNQQNKIKNKMEHKENKNSTPQWNKGHQVETSNFPLPYHGPWSFHPSLLLEHSLPSWLQDHSSPAFLKAPLASSSSLPSFFIYQALLSASRIEKEKSQEQVGGLSQVQTQSVMWERQRRERETWSLRREKEETLIPPELDLQELTWTSDQSCEILSNVFSKYETRHKRGQIIYPKLHSLYTQCQDFNPSHRIP